MFISEKDTIPPTIVNCPSSEMTYEVADGTESATLVSWIEPTAADKSSNVTLLVKTHSPGQMFRVGSATVMYMFADSSNNIASCTFVVTVIRGTYLDQGFGKSHDYLKSSICVDFLS